MSATPDRMAVQVIADALPDEERPIGYDLLAWQNRRYHERRSTAKAILSALDSNGYVLVGPSEQEATRS